VIFERDSSLVFVEDMTNLGDIVRRTLAPKSSIGFTSQERPCPRFRDNTDSHCRPAR
jgi:hypothetical protein